jgi:hypothetical protein
VCNAHYGPANDLEATLCPTPRCKGRRYDAAGVLDVLHAVVFDHATRVREMWADKTMARLLEYPRERVRVPGEIRDSWDASILRNTALKDFTDESKYNLVHDFSSDSAVIETSMSKSYTPLTSRCHNIGPHARSLLTSISMFGLAGPGFKNFQPIIDLALVGVMKANGPGTEGIKCALHDGTEIYSKQAVVFIVDDSRGIHHTSMQKQSPGYVGACKECDVVGIRVDGVNSTYYPSACSTCKGEEARRRYKEEVAEQGYDHLEGVADPANAPKRMTHAKALASGRAVEGGEAAIDHSYHGTWVLASIRYVCRSLYACRNLAIRSPFLFHTYRRHGAACSELLGHCAEHGERPVPRASQLGWDASQHGQQQGRSIQVRR